MTLPDIGQPVVNWINKHLDQDSIVFEYGSGYSSLYLAERAAKVYSVENDETWWLRVLDLAEKQGFNNLEVYHIPHDEAESTSIKDPLSYSSGSKLYRYKVFRSYVSKIDEFEDESFDLVVVDGRARPSCMFHAMPKVRIGGYLLLDDATRKWYAEGKALMTTDTWKATSILGNRGKITVAWEKL